jgi:hypothetical protein
MLRLQGPVRQKDREAMAWSNVLADEMAALVVATLPKADVTWRSIQMPRGG